MQAVYQQMVQELRVLQILIFTLEDYLIFKSEQDVKKEFKDKVSTNFSSKDSDHQEYLLQKKLKQIYKKNFTNLSKKKIRNF